jgi:MoaA/NifB/PqqE/SkfB family radical SAM enzyme
MTCNGTLLNEEYVKFLEANGMTRIHISFDGAKKDTYEKMRLGADFDKVLHNCELIGKSKIQLFMNVLLTNKEIIEQMSDYIDLAANVGATGVHAMKYQAETLTGFQAPDLRPYKGLFGEFGRKARTKGMMYVGTVTENPTYIGCDDPFICPYVLLNGDVYPCSYMANLRRSEVVRGKQYTTPYQNYRVGNLNDNWMKEIWYGEVFSELRQQLKSNSYPKGWQLTPDALLSYKDTLVQKEERFAYCNGCACLWGESGL